MKLYDFAHFAKLRAERQAAQAVARAAEETARPGSVVELKSRVREWFQLYSEARRRAK